MQPAAHPPAFTPRYAYGHQAPGNIHGADLRRVTPSASRAGSKDFSGAAVQDSMLNQNKVQMPEHVEVVYEEREGRTDLKGLLEFLDALTKQRAKFLEGVYVVNQWAFAGVIPLKHHGFIIKSSDNRFLTLDFGRKGINWDVFEACPDVPEGTCLVKRYIINTSPTLLRSYCEETRPFSFVNNDCSTWSNGLKRVMGMEESHEDPNVSMYLPKEASSTKPEHFGFAPTCYG